MSTSNEVAAMRLALEALKANQPINYCMNNNGEKFPMFSDDPIRQERNEKTIKALEKALSEREALAKQEPDYKALWQQMCERCDELDAKLAKQEQKGKLLSCYCPNCEILGRELARIEKQEQSAKHVGEPVGVFHEDDDIGHVDLIPHQGLLLKDGDKLYNTPQPVTESHKRKPLTDEQKFELARERFSGDWNQRIAIALIEDTEAAHGITEEKNNGTW